MCRRRSFRTSAFTDVRLDKAMIQFSLSETFQHLHTVFQSVYKYFMISVCIFLCDHRLDHPSADRIESVDLRIRVPHRFLFALMKINPFFGEPVCQLFKCQDRIDRAEYSLVSDRLLLLRDTRT